MVPRPRARSYVVPGLTWTRLAFRAAAARRAPAASTASPARCSTLASNGRAGRVTCGSPRCPRHQLEPEPGAEPRMLLLLRLQLDEADRRDAVVDPEVDLLAVGRPVAVVLRPERPRAHADHLGPDQLAPVARGTAAAPARLPATPSGRRRRPETRCSSPASPRRASPRTPSRTPCLSPGLVSVVVSSVTAWSPFAPPGRPAP